MEGLWNKRPARALGSGHWRRRFPAPTLVVVDPSSPPGLCLTLVMGGLLLAVWAAWLGSEAYDLPGHWLNLLVCFSGVREDDLPT